MAVVLFLFGVASDVTGVDGCCVVWFQWLLRCLALMAVVAW